MAHLGEMKEVRTESCGGGGGHISCFSVGSEVTADCVSKSENIGLFWLVILEVSRPRFCSQTRSMSCCLRLLTVVANKTPNERNLRKAGFVLASILGIQSIMAEQAL